MRRQTIGSTAVGCFVLMGVLSGCTQEAHAPAPTVEYYRAHAAEREAQLRACKSDPGALSETAHCVNAREAERIESVGSLRNLPSMGLSAPKAEDPPSSSAAQ